MKRKFRLFGIIFRIVVIVAAAALFISYISIFISPSISVIPHFFGLYFIPLVIINIFLLLIALIGRSNAGWITLILLLPSLLFTDMFIRWGNDVEEANGHSLKICTYNVGVFSLSRGGTMEQTVRNIRLFIEEHSPDIVCLQEYHGNGLSDITSSFWQYPYVHHHLLGTRNMVGNVILSRYPIIDSGKLLFEGSGNLCIYADISHPRATIRIYNAHLESHAISFTTLIKNIRGGKELSEKIYEVHDKMATKFKKRALQVDAIVEHCQKTPYPAIICGDFNDTPMSYTYHSLTKNRKDSFEESGKGFSATYSVLWPLLRIDYILYPQTFRSISHITPRVDYSDHYPVISEIIIP